MEVSMRTNTPTTNTKQRKSTTLSKASTQKESKSKNPRKAKMISVEQRYAMIEEAAYFISEKYGFAPEKTIDCWLLAEKEIDDKILL